MESLHSVRFPMPDRNHMRSERDCRTLGLRAGRGGSCRPHIKYHHNYPRPSSGQWAPLALEEPQELDPPVPGGLGVPRYWPVAYLHKGPPPNITYFKYNETTPTEDHNLGPLRPKIPERPERPGPVRAPERPDIDRIDRPELPRPKPGEFIKVNTEKPNDDTKTRRDEARNIANITDDIPQELDKVTTTTSKTVVATDEPKKVAEKEVKMNVSDVEIIKPIVAAKDNDKIEGIDDKLEDLTGSIEVLDIEDAKTGDKEPDVKTLEAEERQIEALGRLLASRRGGQLILEKRSQKDLESKNIAIDKDLIDFNFGNRFPTTERRGIIRKITKDEIERERLNNDKSLEVSETTFVRPPRVLSTTENIRKAIINGKVFYDATIREQRDIYNNATRKPRNFRNLEDTKAPSVTGNNYDIFNNTTRKSKSFRHLEDTRTPATLTNNHDIFNNSTRKSRNFRHLEDSRAPSVINNSNYGKKKVIKARNVNPVRRVRRVYRKKYNPEEVRKRLLERERSLREAKDAAKN
ncbi:hypothetical protein MSG28_006501 [Choristoneura fumiferana]|nr:hypothetical protein MSG28_006501 [Choristoneura fumiferana]